jgi:hypothetical protein
MVRLRLQSLRPGPRKRGPGGRVTASMPAPDDKTDIVPRLQRALAPVLPAIEAIVTRLATGATPPLELERAGRALAALTRTLRELNGLLSQHQPPAGTDDDDDGAADIDEFRRDLARRMDAMVAARAGTTEDGV